MIKNNLEVIVNKVEDAKMTNQSQVDQIEYCVDLQHGGLSPAIEDVEKISKISNKKVRVMLRNHYDNFYITQKQVEEIIDFIKLTNHLNIDGYVFGAINQEGSIDYRALEQVIGFLNGKSLTFHKAFDFVENKTLHLEKLLQYQEIKFILTSGGEGNPLDHLDFFENINYKYKKNILIGGGVNLDVINQLKQHGFSNFHIGKAAREKNNYESPLSLNNIKLYKGAINE